MKRNEHKGVNWDLSELYKNTSDPKIESDSIKATSLAFEFTKKYKGKVTLPELTASRLEQILKEYETILEIIYILSSYASYLHSVDALSEPIGKFYQKTEELSVKISTELIWFDLELLTISDTMMQEFEKNLDLKNYHHYLKKSRVFKPFTLSEKEEKILNQKSQTSSTAFIRLYDETTSAQRFSLTVKGKKKMLSYAEIVPYLNNEPDRIIRKKATFSLTNGFKDHAKIYTTILNNLLLDKKITDEIRGYHYPEEATFLSYEVSSDIVEKMTKAVEKRYDLCEKFYLAKKIYLNADALYEWDRYSLFSAKDEKHYTWDEAKKIVLDVYYSFSPTFGDIAKKFFDARWIDSQVSPGKRDGAFCSYATPNHHPYILMSFTGTMRDVETLAHELGHGIHAYLSKEQTLLEYWPSTAVAEVASVFGEMLVFDYLYKQQTDPTLKLSMLGNKLQSSFATIFRQNAFYLFERDIHEHRRREGELQLNDFNTYFQNRLQAMFGKGLTLTDGHKYWWMPILHFYHYNFYVFSYAFGEMMTMALYARYKDLGETFVDDYTKALKLGGSKTPVEITKTMGVDIENPDFWNKGLDLLDSYIEEFIQLTKTHKKIPR